MAARLHDGPAQRGRAEGRAPPGPGPASQLLRILSGRRADAETLSKAGLSADLCVSSLNVCLCWVEQ